MPAAPRSTRRLSRRLVGGVLSCAIGALALLLVLGREPLPDRRPRNTASHAAMRDAGVDPPTLLGAPPPKEVRAPDPVHPGSSEPAFLITGVVLAEVDGRPLSDARLWLAQTGQSRIPAGSAARSDAEGRFALAAKGGGPHDLCALADGFLLWSGAVPAHALPVASPDVVVRLAAGLSIQGTVTDAGGKPIPGATVWCSAPGNRSAWPHTDAHLPVGLGAGARTVSDARGAFTLSGLAEGARYEVRAYAPFTVGPGSHLWPVVAAGTSGTIIRLQPCAEVALTVASSAGMPLSPGLVTFRMRCPNTLGSVAPVIPPQSMDPIASPAAPPSKVFTLVAVAPAGGGGESDLTCTFVIEALGFRAQSLRVPVVLGARVHQAVILEPDGHFRGMRPVRFEASLPSGALVEGAIVFTLSHESGREGRIGVPFRDGVAESDALLPVGRYRLAPWGGGDRAACAYWPATHPRLDVEVPPGEGRVRCHLPLRGNWLELDVVTADGTSVRGFDLRATGAAMRFELPWQERWDAEWRGEPLPGPAPPRLLVPEGEVVIHVNLPERGAATGTFQADGSGTVDRLSLRLDPRHEVDLRGAWEAINSAR